MPIRVSVVSSHTRQPSSRWLTTLWSTAEEILGADDTTDAPWTFLRAPNDSLLKAKQSQEAKVSFLGQGWEFEGN